MNTIKATVQNRRIELTAPDNLPDGTEVLVDVLVPKRDPFKEETKTAARGLQGPLDRAVLIVAGLSGNNWLVTALSIEGIP